MGYGGCYGRIGRGLELAQQRKDLVADLVAAVGQGGVGGVLDMGEGMGAGILLYVVTGEGEKRTHYKTLDRQDAVETRQTRAPKQVDEEGFGRVVAVVGGEDGRVALLAAEGGEPVVAKGARSLLDTLAVGARMGKGVEPDEVKRYGIATGKGADETLVAMAVAGAEVEIAMRNGKGEGRGVHKVGKYHGVDASTNGKQHLLPRGEEVLLADVRYELLQHYLMIILRMRRSPLNSIP